MTVATTSVRWPVAKELIDLVRTAVNDPTVSVEPGWPGEVNMRADMIWIDDISSQIDVPVSTAGRRHRDDFFTITVLFRTTGSKDLDTTMLRLEELYAYLEDVVAEDSTLAGMDGVVEIQLTSADVTCGRTPDGFLGFARTEVRVHSRLT